MASEAGELAHEVVRLLRDVASGAVASEDAMRVLTVRGNGKVWDRLFDAAWHCIQHFGDDLDIRSKEPDYDLRQRADMLRVAAEIEQKYGVGDLRKQQEPGANL